MLTSNKLYKIYDDPFSQIDFSEQVIVEIVFILLIYEMGINRIIFIIRLNGFVF